mgnify:CR=1 FL=1
MTAHLFRNFVDKFLHRSISDISETIDTSELYKRLNYTFRHADTLSQALKHRSYLTQSGEPRIASNERLELLGDAVLGFVVTDFLYHKFPYETEGILTNYKSLLVSGRLLAEVANDFGLGEFLLLNESEARSGGRKRTSILADAVEAIIGAIYLDGGIEPARRFIMENITHRLETLLKDGRLRNNKSLLQEHCQSLCWDGPIYRIESESGPDHRKVFTVSAVVNGKVVGRGKGTSKKKAEQNAASEALQELELI